MDAQSVRLDNFIGIKKGLGLDTFFLDLTGMNGMIALTGRNGSAKTTVLESLTPFWTMPSRANPALINQVYGRNAVREFCFIHNGDHWRTKIVLDAESRRVEGYVYINESDHSENDGKISTYKELIIKEFGTQGLFFNSVFCPQNSPKMSSLRPGDLKALIAEFLGKRLALLVAQEKDAKECSNILLSGISTVDRDIDKQNDIIMQHSEAGSTLARAQNELRSSTSDMKAVETHIDLDQRAVALLQLDLVNQKTDKAQILGMKEDVLDIESEIKLILKQRSADTMVIEEDLHDNRNRTHPYETTLEDREAIERASDQEKELSGQLEDLQRDKADVEKRLSVSRETLSCKEGFDHEAEIIHNDALTVNRTEWQEIKDVHGETQSDIDQTERSLDSIENDPALQELSRVLQGYKESAEDLERRGTVCYPEANRKDDPLYVFDCNSEDCPFIERALKAKEEIPTIEAQITTATANNEESTKVQQKYLDGLFTTKGRIVGRLKACETLGRERVESHTKAQAERKDEIERLGADKAAYRATSDSLGVRITTFQGNIDKAQSLSARLPEIQVAESRLSDLKAAREALDATMKSTTAGYDSRIAAKNKKISETQVEIDALQVKIDPEIDAKISDLSDKIRHERMSLEGSQAKIKETEADIVRLEQNVKTADTAGEELQGLTKRRKSLSVHQSEWKYMQGKCGKDGIQALEINSIAPSIVHDGNAMLEKAFGPGAMVDIETLDPDGKEILQLKAIDSDGESVLIGDRSGGQQVYGMKAMRLAMTGISRRKSGREFLSAMADEEDGALDVETAIMFTQLYRTFLEEYGFKKVIYISHKPECVAMADHIIELGKGGVQ